MEYWYEFRAYNSQKLYGYGTSDEADRYEDHLNRNREVNHYAAYRLPDAMADEMQIGDNGGFSLSTALGEAGAPRKAMEDRSC